MGTQKACHSFPPRPPTTSDPCLPETSVSIKAAISHLGSQCRLNGSVTLLRIGVSHQNNCDAYSQALHSMMARLQRLVPKLQGKPNQVQRFAWTLSHFADKGATMPPHPDLLQDHYPKPQTVITVGTNSQKTKKNKKHNSPKRYTACMN
eukprot:928914-Amphidinium_carterae.1